MSWIPVVATVLGAVIGLGSGLLIDQVRSRRDSTEKRLTTRMEAYVSYLSSLHDANEALRAVSLGDYPQDLMRDTAARAAFRAAGVIRTREHIILLAPETVIRAADDAFRNLRTLRDRIGQGESLAEYQLALEDYAKHLYTLRMPSVMI